MTVLTEATFKRAVQQLNPEIYVKENITSDLMNGAVVLWLTGYVKITDANAFWEAKIEQFGCSAIAKLFAQLTDEKVTSMLNNNEKPRFELYLSEIMAAVIKEHDGCLEHVEGVSPIFNIECDRPEDIIANYNT